MTLYELTGEYLKLEQMIEQKPDDDLKKKLEAYGKIVRDTESTIIAINEATKKLAERKKNLDKNLASLKESILATMLATRKKKVLTILFEFSIRSAADAIVIGDEDAIPDQFWKKEPKLDKKELNKWRKDEKKIFLLSPILNLKIHCS